MAESAKTRLSYVTRMAGLLDLGGKREIRRELLVMVGEVLDGTEREAMVLRGLELAARLTGACDMTASLEPPAQPPDMSRFERPARPAAVSLPAMLDGNRH